MSNPFETVSLKDLPEYHSRGTLFRHKKTGCQVFQIHNDDPDNLFAFTFKTPPADNTGVPHILEHSVLSGSEKFPLKDPFAQLLKGSMHTFLNAMTYPDKTMYPAGSMVKKDFFNLLLVYGDAVFFPLLRREVFDQEGYHITANGGLGITGVVYNEMKGNYGNHDSIAGEWSYRSLFNGSPYQFDSGGDPDYIPDLTYEQFISFHKNYYHPSNCRIFLYGDIPAEEILAFLETHFLSRFEKKDVSPDPGPASFSAPPFIQVFSPLGPDESPDGKTTLLLNWLLTPVTDRTSALSLEILSEILLGNNGSPLRKAISESPLGEDLSPVSGLEINLKELTFTSALRGSDPSKMEDFVKLVLNELESLYRSGVPEKLIQGALHQIEFRNREISKGSSFGLRLLNKTMRGWLNGLDPFKSVVFNPWMEDIKKEVQKNEKYFSNLISTMLIANNRRTTVAVTPDPEYGNSFNKRTEERLALVKTKLGRDFPASIKKRDDALKKFQDTPETEKDLKCIPTLNLSDLPGEVESITLEENLLKETPLFSLEEFTNGIGYIDLFFNINDLTEEESLYLPLLTRVVRGMGTKTRSYSQAAGELALSTGGFSSFTETGRFLESKTDSTGSGEVRAKEFLVFRLKALTEKIPAAGDIVFEILTEADFSYTRRLKEILVELRNDYKSRLLPRGNWFASLRAAGYLSPVARKEDLLNGIDQLTFLHDLSKRGDNSLDEISAALSSLYRKIITRKRLTLQITGDESTIKKGKEMLYNKITSVNEGTPVAGIRSYPPLPRHPEGTISEYISVPSEIGFSAAVYPADLLGGELHPAQSVLSHILSTGILWENIRMRGGAYGASASMQGMEGLALFSSYRDPLFPGTPKVFSESLRTVKEGLKEEDILKGIIGTIGKETRSLSPNVRGFIGIRRKLFGITDALRQQKRDRILSVTRKDLLAAADGIIENENRRKVVIMGPENRISDIGEGYSKIKKTVVQL